MNYFEIYWKNNNRHNPTAHLKTSFKARYVHLIKINKCNTNLQVKINSIISFQLNYFLNYFEINYTFSLKQFSKIINPAPSVKKERKKRINMFYPSLNNDPSTRVSLKEQMNKKLA